ncbi:response regulator [Streptomyces gobiensis]|uniref:response regulator n=1 Tax=Streptomyces gobiensis TaxID=2875706 RepID=UPI001E2AE5AF|nr:response regulator transcription factor [Streptomyces gobiensis]UGY92700.1 response regulator transcription factor [Streptomyces gobiensis]
MIRVVVVDDEQLVRSGVRMILGTAEDIEVVADCSGPGAVETVLAARPDVVLLDIRMPQVDGLAVLRGLCEAYGRHSWRRRPAVSMLTTFDADDYLTAALRLGAAGYLLKDAEPERLIQAVRSLAAGEATLDPGVTRAVIGGYLEGVGGTPEAVRAVATLTPREREVLTLLADGMSNAAIARQMGLAHGTVKDHVSALLSKLGGINRVQAAIVADRAGLTGRPGEPC